MIGAIQVGSAGYFALIFVFVVLIAAVLMFRNRIIGGKGKSDGIQKQYEKLDEALLAQTPDDKLVNAVAANLMGKITGSRSDPLVALAHLSRGRNAVFFTWMLCKEVEHNGVEALCKKPAVKFTDVGVEGLKTLGAEKTAAAVAAYLDADGQTAQNTQAVLCALDEEQPLALCVTYIRDNAEQFVD